MGRPMLYKYEINDIIDDMEIVAFVRDKVNNDMRAVCRCSFCGRTKIITFFMLNNRRGTTHKSCGQYFKTLDKRFYRIWCGMKTRIYNKNYHHYHRYGGRNLTCDYDRFIDFYDEMYDSYLDAIEKLGSNISIDRINNDLGYVRGNLRWASAETQARNSNRMKRFYCFSPDGEVYVSNNQTAFANAHKLSSKQLNACLKGRFQTTCGWTFVYEDLIFGHPNGVIEEMYY